MNKLISMSGIVGILALAMAGACNGTSTPPPSADAPTATAVLRMNGPPKNPNFCGNSVRICGDRVPEADPKYFCRNHLSGRKHLSHPCATDPCAPEPECPCFNFQADGELGVATNGSDVLSELCPSVDLNSNGTNSDGKWTFKYRIFTGTDCTGEQMTGEPGNPHNLVCYDSSDIPARDFPNETHEETLDPGENENHIICLTENAHKGWDFSSCAIVTPDPPAEFEMDCGCHLVNPANPTCECDQDIPLTPDCVADPSRDCHIVCG